MKTFKKILCYKTFLFRFIMEPHAEI